MSRNVRGDDNKHKPRSIGKACLAILLTTAATGGIASLGLAFSSPPPLDPAYAAAAGFLAAGSVVALRSMRSRPRLEKAAVEAPPAPKAMRPASEEKGMATDIADLAEAVGSARISRILLPFGAEGDASAAIALARRLAGDGASTVLVDFGAENLARETGLIEPPSDVRIIAASPTTFAHSIHRVRASRAHVLSASIDPDAGDRTAMTEAVATVLDALEEAYARTVVAFPADRLRDVEALIHADAAVVVPASSANDAAVLALLADLGDRGIGDILLVDGETEIRRSAAA